MGKLEQYNIQTTDWRQALQNNAKRTQYVLLLFILIYLCLGFIIDMYYFGTSNYIKSQNYSTQHQQIIPFTLIKDTFYDLVTFKQIPIATFTMVVVAILSILIAYQFYNKIVMLGTDYHEITQNDFQNLQEKQLYNVMEELKIASNLQFMPKIYIIHADYMNAFASGYSEKSAMVAITKGLIEKLDRSELQAVMAHELSHIRHNDIRLTLTVTLLSNLMLIFIDFAFRGILYSQNNRNRNNSLATVIIIARFLLPIVTILLMMYLSRVREFMADSGSVELTRDNEPLARALIKIHTDTQTNQDHYRNLYENTPHEDIRKAFYFYDPLYAKIKTMTSINSIFSTHPSLKDRLKALGIEAKTKK